MCLFPFYCTGILETSNREVVIEQPRTNETSITSEQLLPVTGVSEEKLVVVSYAYAVTFSFSCDSIMNQNILIFTLCH